MDWVEKGKAPERIIATRYKDNSRKEIEMQRPVYPYPDFPHYIGGDPTLPQNYKRKTHLRNNVPIPAKKIFEIKQTKNNTYNILNYEILLLTNSMLLS